MHFLLLPQGSAGDVNPFLGIARELLARGHTVEMGTCGYFRDTIERAGVGFHEIGTTEQYYELVRNPDLWHPTKAPGVVFGHRDAPQAIRDTHQLVVDFHQRHPDGVVAAGTLAMGARIALETHPGLRLASIHLQPGVLRSIVDPPVLAGVRFPAWMPRMVVRGFFWLGDRIVDRHVEKSVTTYRRELGLPPQSRYLQHWVHSPRAILGLFPDWFATAPDWPAWIRLTGFVTEDGAQGLSSELTEWLSAGEPPIVYTFGSAMAHGEALFAAACASSERLKRRGLMLTQFPEQLPKTLPAGVRVERYVPLGELLPRCALLVHHGGIGTTARGLQAGIPQIIVPLSHDQFDNAERIRRLGVGDSVPKPKLTGESLAACIERCLESPEMPQACRTAAERCRGVNGAAAASDALERV